MTKTLRRFLTDERLRAEFDGVYTGVIADVQMMEVNNGWEGKKVTEPAIRFIDGLLLIPNQRMRRELISWFGSESDNWHGLTIRVRRVAIEYTERKTKERKVR